MTPTIDNIRNNSDVGYSLLRITGRTGQTNDCSVVIVRLPKLLLTEWPSCKGYYKAVIPLQKGRNEIIVHCGLEKTKLFVTYDPEKFKSNYFIRLIYLIGKDSNGVFQAPPSQDCSPKSAVKRIRLAAQLIQTFIAQCMNDHGHSHKTFQLELDHDGQPIVHIFRSKYTIEEIYKFGNMWDDGGYIAWEHFLDELKSIHHPNTIDLVVLGDSRWDGKRAYAHSFLGGGNLCLIGSGNLYSWAPSVDKICKYWLNDEKVEEYLLDNSFFRGTYWANFATGVGSCLHELGHIFGLKHTRYGIMGKGYHNFNRYFMIKEPGFPGPIILTKEAGASFYKSTCKLLSKSPFLCNMYASNEPAKIPPALVSDLPTKLLYWSTETSDFFQRSGRIPNAWIEVRNEQLVTVYTEIQRNNEDKTIILYDPTKKYYIKLTTVKSYWSYNPKKYWKWLDCGQWQDSKFNPSL